MALNLAALRNKPVKTDPAIGDEGRSAPGGDLGKEMAEFSSRAGMSAQWFCQFVEERREDGATNADLARELDDPRRTVRFTEETVESTYRDLSRKLSRANPYWREEGLDPPPVAPRPPVTPGHSE